MIFEDLENALNIPGTNKSKKKRQQSTLATIGIVLVCVFVSGSVLVVQADILGYYPLCVFAVILFIEGVFILMLEIFLLYGSIAGK